MEEDKLNANIIEYSDIIDRKGRVVFSREFILTQNEETLREIFSNFFPIAINTFHHTSYYDSIEYLGVSPHFDVVEMGCISPTYKITMFYNEGKTVFSHFTKENF
jgi:hypothetical protein